MLSAASVRVSDEHVLFIFCTASLIGYWNDCCIEVLFFGYMFLFEF